MKTPIHLINKYNRAVPRYTSYPPANFFQLIDSGIYRQMLVDSNKDEPQNISLYFHIPFCTQLCYFCGCNTQKKQKETEIRRYIEAVKQEMRLTAALLSEDRQVSQVHWGGGTPNSISVDMISELMQLSQELFRFSESAEIAIECHPALLTENYIAALVNIGFNRISLGIQDFNTQVLSAINRAQPSMPMVDMMRIIRAYPQITVNFDFIYGLPYQNKERFAQTIAQAIALAPDRLVTFSYAHVPWLKKAQKILEKQGLPSPQLKLELFEQTYNQLLAAGYHSIGLDHFAKANDELYVALQNKQLHRNFQGYCTRKSTGQVYAFGTTGITQLNRGYAQNTKDIGRYIALLSAGEFAVEKGYQLNTKERLVRTAINAIMCNGYWELEQMAKVTEMSTEYIKEVLGFNVEKFDVFEEEGIIQRHNNSIRITEMGRFFVRIIAAQFDPVFAATQQNFSKAL